MIVKQKPTTRVRIPYEQSPGYWGEHLRDFSHEYLVSSTYIDDSLETSSSQIQWLELIYTVVDTPRDIRLQPR